MRMRVSAAAPAVHPSARRTCKDETQAAKGLLVDDGIIVEPSKGLNRQSNILFTLEAI